MTNPSKAIGTAAETALVRYLRVNGWGNAERRALHGNTDLGDVTGCPLLVFECKAGKQAHRPGDALMKSWLAQAEQERLNAGADIGILVIKTSGAADPSRWLAVLPADALCYLITGEQPTAAYPPVRMLLRHLLPMLRRAGYGDRLEATA